MDGRMDYEGVEDWNKRYTPKRAGHGISDFCHFLCMCSVIPSIDLAMIQCDDASFE